MIERATTTLTERRGSRWGADGLYYPAEEERDVPLSGAAIRLIFYLYSALRQVLYARDPLVYVAADQFIYYQPHDPTRKVAPDVWVCFGVPQEPERAVFRTWEEGETPGFVVEVSSKLSRGEDRGPKLTLYQETLRCSEYLLYDEDLDELLLYRHNGDTFQAVVPDSLGRLHSDELGVSFAREPELLVRVINRDGSPVPTVNETVEHAEILERIRRRLEEEATELVAVLQRESRRADEEQRRADEEQHRADEEQRRADQEQRRAHEERRRSEALAAEVERLRAENERLRQQHEGSR